GLLDPAARLGKVGRRVPGTVRSTWGVACVRWRRRFTGAPAMTDAVPEPTMSYVQVALNLPLRREFTYALPPGVTAAPGNRVRVNFHGRALGGVVTAVSSETDLPPKKVKTIELLLDGETLLPPSLLELSRRMAATYGCSLGEALDATLPSVAKRRGQRRLPHVEL